MENNNIEINKASGEKVKFSLQKLRASLRHSGADDITIEQVINKVKDELYQGISTKEIYNRVFALLKKKKSHFASKYKLKKAIYELGPTGFPFERFVSTILHYSGYKTEVSKIIQGQCIKHEVDVIAHKKNETTIIECKFHSEQGNNCNAKVPLYINSRYQDLKTHWNANKKNGTKLTQGWVVTNTRFTKDALQYGKCVDLYLLSWDYPIGNALKNRIDRLSLYPITVSTLLTAKEKEYLLQRNIILCRELVDESFYLDYLNISEIRKEKIINELKLLCKS